MKVRGRALLAFWYLALALAVSLTARAARADLPSDADLLASAWTARGARAERLTPMFLEHGRPRAVSLPKTAYDTRPPGCTSVAFLATRSTDFVVRTDPLITPKRRPSGALVDRSVAGTVLLTRCGESRSALTRLSVELRVARAAVEVVETEGDRPPPAIASILPERDSGPVAAPADPGPRPSLEALDVRVERARRRAQRENAASVTHRILTADPDGTGHETLGLEEGCHEIELFASPNGNHPVDVDAEIRDMATERLMARDRSDSADARLDFCVGSSTGVELTYAGAPGGVRVLLADARFNIADGIPNQWGARARAALAGAMRRRQAPIIVGAPIVETLGVSGVTAVPVSIEPGGCYLAGVGTLRGEARTVELTARLGAKTTTDTSGPLLDGAAISFCTDHTDRADLEVEVRGGAVAWVLSVWRIGQKPLGVGP